MTFSRPKKSAKATQNSKVRGVANGADRILPADAVKRTASAREILFFFCSVVIAVTTAGKTSHVRTNTLEGYADVEGNYDGESSLGHVRTESNLASYATAD